MTEKSIPFKSPMVRAILDGRKTQTRRVLQHRDPADSYSASRLHETAGWQLKVGQYNVYQDIKVRYAVGDRLYVREAWRTEARFNHLAPRDVPQGALVSYEADYNQEPNDGCRGRYRHARYMPRWAARVFIDITAVKVERLQDISDEDAEAEGCDFFGDQTLAYKGKFAALWAEIHGPDAWAANPWVCAISFERVK